MPRSTDPRVERVIAWFEGLTPQSLDAIGALYTEDARFKDPFNTLQGTVAIRQVFEHMYETLETPRFQVLDAVAQGDDAFLTWDFVFRLRSGSRPEITVRGATHLQFAADGRVRLHRDYWDAAEELYEKLPLIGPPMRWLRRRMSA